MPSWVGYPKKLSSKPAQELIEAVADARTKLTFGQEFRQNNRESTWERSEDQYAGNHWNHTPVPDDTMDLITVNMSFSTVQTIVPYATGSDPTFVVEPYSGEATIRNAKIQQAFLNRLWRSHEISGRQELETATVDFLIYGDGYLKVGYDIVEERITEDGDTAEIAKLWVSRINPWDLWIDPTADGIHNARWVCQRLRMTRDELENNPAYRNVDERNVNYAAAERDYNERREQLEDDVYDGSEYATVYEFYDLVKMRLLSFSSGNLPIRVVEDIGGAPIAQLGNYRIPNSPYHMGELEQLWSLQEELNLTRSQMVTHRRRNVQKYFARKDSLDDSAVDALLSAVTNDIVWVGGDEPLDSLVKPAQVAPLQGDAYNMSQTISADIYEISGVNEYLRGAAPEIRRTATEASIIEGASNVKSQFKLRQVERVAQDVGTMILRTAAEVYPRTDFEEMQLFLTGREAEMVQKADLGQTAADMLQQGASTDEIGAMLGGEEIQSDILISPTPEIWKGRYEVLVEQASTELRNPIMREQKYRDMFERLLPAAPTLMQLGVAVNIKRLLELWFEAAGIDDIDAMFDPRMIQAMQAQAQQAEGGEVAPGQAEGEPAVGNAQAPQDAVTSENSGTMPPNLPAD